MGKILVALCALMFCSVSGAATYVYQGSPYTSIITGTTYNTSMRLAGSFTTAAPLPANMPATDIGPLGSNLVQSWNFNDGVNTYTPANSYIVPLAAGSAFVVATDASGNVGIQLIGIFSPLPPHASGSPINGFALGPSRSTVVTGVPCAVLIGTTCADGDPSAAIGAAEFIGPTGTFALAPATATPVPGLGEWGVTVLAVLLSLTMIVAVRRRRAPR